MLNIKPWKSIFREFAELSDEDFFVDKYEDKVVNYFKQKQYFKLGGKGPEKAIDEFSKKNHINLKDLDKKYIIDNIYWG